MRLRDKVEELEAQLRGKDRKLGAYFDWTQSVLRVEPEKVVDVEREGRPVLRVHLRRLDRSFAGVAVVHTAEMDWFDEPEYVDDLIARWRRDPSCDIREAADAMRALQEAALRA